MVRSVVVWACDACRFRVNPYVGRAPALVIERSADRGEAKVEGRGVKVRHGSSAAVGVSVRTSSPSTVMRVTVAGDGQFVVVHELVASRA